VYERFRVRERLKMYCTEKARTLSAAIYGTTSDVLMALVRLS
jgi:hypothetical protein